MELMKKFKNIVLKQKLFVPEEKVIIAVSGGADSIALLDLLVNFSKNNFPLQLAVASLDHGLRKESKDEINFVQGLSRKYNLPFFNSKVELLKEKQTAIEERARKERYIFLEKIAKIYQAFKIAVAHHADDQVETVLLNFLNGTGIAGLSGMKIRRPIFHNSKIFLVRPLFYFTKKEIIQYLKKKKLPWCEDKSNLDEKYTRNLIRHKIIPFIKQSNYQQFDSNLIKTSTHCRNIVNYLEQEAENFLQENMVDYCMKPGDLQKFLYMINNTNNTKIIPVSKLEILHNALLPFVFKKILQSLSTHVTMKQKHYKLFSNLLKQKKGKIKLGSGIEIHQTPSFTVVISMSQFCKLMIPKSITPETKVKICDNASIKAYLEDNLKQSYKTYSLLDIGLSADKLKLPLQVRLIQQGEEIHPLSLCPHF